MAKTHVSKLPSLSLSSSPLPLQDDDCLHSLKIQVQQQLKEKNTVLVGNIKVAFLWSECPSLKGLQITNAGEGMEKREPSYTVAGHVS